METLLGSGAGRPDRSLPRHKARETGADANRAEAARFTDLYRTTHQRIYEFACRRVGPQVATEVVAETFLVAWRKFAEVPESPLPWLYRVASYEVANQRRRQRRVDQLQIEVELLQRRTAVTDSSDVLPDLVALAFDGLSPDDQEVLRLATWERLSLIEGATVLGCSVSAYRMRLHRARLRLGKRVTQEQADARRDTNDTRLRTTTDETLGLRVHGAEVAL